MWFFEVRGFQGEKPYREAQFYNTKYKAKIQRQRMKDAGWLVTTVAKVPDGMIYKVVPPPPDSTGPVFPNPIFDNPSDDPGWPYR